MAAAYVIQIADAVVAALNSAVGIVPPLEAKRAEVVVSELAKLDDLQTSVIPGTLAAAVWDLNKRLMFDWIVSVWLQQRIDSDPPNIDSLRVLIDQIITLFLGQQIGLDSRTARCISAETRQLPSPEEIDVMTHCAIGIFFTFRVTQ
jgi:hypothetical protein